MVLNNVSNIKFRKYWRKTSLKKENDGNFLLEHIAKHKPKNFLEIGIFHGVSRVTRHFNLLGVER